MKQLIAAIYLSFGFLFYLLNNFGGFHATHTYNFIVFGFILTGIAYLFNDLADSNKKKTISKKEHLRQKKQSKTNQQLREHIHLLFADYFFRVLET